MIRPEASPSLEDILEAFAEFKSQRPAGMVDSMHYGFVLRNLGMIDREGAPEAILQLEDLAAGIKDEWLPHLTPLLGMHAWRAGRLQMRSSVTRIWTDLSPVARGHYLAGFSYSLMSWSVWEDENALISGHILCNLADASLSAECAAEIAANALRSNSLDLLKAVLAHRDFDPDGQINRNRGYPDQTGFARQLSVLSTRVIDVLLEAAVRCQKPEAARILLDLGASPDLPCWTLERSFNEWFSLLSFALDLMSGKEGEARTSLATLIDLLLQYGADPQGLECEGKNNPLLHAIRGRHWELVDRLLELGARFEGSVAYQPDDFLLKGQFIPAGHPLLHHSSKDLDWVTATLGPLIPLVNFWEVPLFYQGHSQGGWTTTFLCYFLKDEHLLLLKKYVSKGLPTKLSATIIWDLVKGGHCQALCYLQRDNPLLPQILSRIREHWPDFGAPKSEVSR